MQEIQNQLKSGIISPEEANDLYDEAKKEYDYAIQTITIDKDKDINTDTEICTGQELG